MHKRRSTLDPIQKLKKTKQTQYYAILQTCMQIPNDDKLIARKLILNEQDYLTDIFQKYKKYKNLRQLQILLRKFIHNYKNSQHSKEVILFGSKQTYFNSQHKSKNKIQTLSSLQGSVVESPDKQKIASSSSLKRNLTKKTLVDLDNMEWQKRIQHQIQKQIQTNMNQKEQDFATQDYQISFMSEEGSLMMICQQKQTKQRRLNQSQKILNQNGKLLQKSFKFKNHKDKLKIENDQRQITEIDININWHQQIKQQFKKIKQIQPKQTQQNANQNPQAILKQLNINTNSLKQYSQQFQKGYPGYQQRQVKDSPNVRKSDCYSSKIKDFIQNSGFAKMQPTIRSSKTSNVKEQFSDIVYPTRRNTLAGKQNSIRKQLFCSKRQITQNVKQACYSQVSCNQSYKNKSIFVKQQKQYSLQSLSQQKCKITNSTVTYRPQTKIKMQNFQEITCQTSKKTISINNNKQTCQQWYKNYRNNQQQQNTYISNSNISSVKSLSCSKSNYLSNIKSKSKQMDFYKRIQMAINGQMD